MRKQEVIKNCRRAENVKKKGVKDECIEGKNNKKMADRGASFST